ncbi:hypothetical protein ACIPVK_04985 [Paeniglutamicibacter sp. MACA_103]|uniref:hypothetical protein n=1 Tax=Paeniglutamicibacter sp. MACA_103 TaxID=3377337 RepID=UPI0038939AE2
METDFHTSLTDPGRYLQDHLEIAAGAVWAALGLGRLDRLDVCRCGWKAFGDCRELCSSTSDSALESSAANLRPGRQALVNTWKRGT